MRVFDRHLIVLSPFYRDFRAVFALSIVYTSDVVALGRLMNVGYEFNFLHRVVGPHRSD